MTSKQEIKDLFVAELKNTSEYQTILQIKQYILNQIAEPNIQEEVCFNFSSPMTLEQRNNIKVCMLLEFGFYTDNMNENCVVIDMKKFLI